MADPLRLTTKCLPSARSASRITSTFDGELTIDLGEPLLDLELPFDGLRRFFGDTFRGGSLALPNGVAVVWDSASINRDRPRYNAASSSVEAGLGEAPLAPAAETIGAA
jgi:hypothetical protein